jgi:beta-glucosidase
MGSDSVLSERALREIYLMPFMLAQKFGKPWSYMSAYVYLHYLLLKPFPTDVWIYRYNRVNGVHVSENPHILRDILRKEWGFEGLVMSDWYASVLVIYSMFGA